MNARKGKQNQPGVIHHDKNRKQNILDLQQMLINKTFNTSVYTTFFIYEPKEREIFRLPYFPDRILHHAIMLQLEAMFNAIFTNDTYSCIKGKGIHAISYALRKALLNKSQTQYCLKLDIKKFYPSIDHTILKSMLRRKIKDHDLLQLLDEIIDSADGVPIGNYLSQYFANFYLTYFDHWIKEQMKVWKYFRYADDMVIPAGSKEQLHKILAAIRKYLSTELKLEIKGNYQIFPVSARGIDLAGYIHFHIKQRYFRMLKRNDNTASRASYKGWFKHANCINLLRKAA